MTLYIKDLNALPEYFDRYILLLGEKSLDESLSDSNLNQLLNHAEKLKLLGKTVYAEGKWTIAEIIQHLIDVERIFSYRALRIGRNDKTPLSGFEEDDYAAASFANDRSLDDLLEELKTVRSTTQFLFNSFNKQCLLYEGTSSGKTVTTASLGFTIGGHLLHHVKVIEERYLPLLQN